MEIPNLNKFKSTVSPLMNKTQSVKSTLSPLLNKSIPPSIPRLDLQFQELLDNLSYVRSIIGNIRIVLSIFVISWVVAISMCIMKQPKLDTSTDHERYYYLHRVMFGDESPLGLLLRAWIFVFILYLVTPFVGKLLILLKAYTVVG